MLSTDVAVAVATCGRPDGLARCLELVTAGTAQPGELIVVDQAPSPGARRAVEACTAVPVRYVEQPRRGLSASRNLALSLATRPVLAVTDDDCAPDPGWVAAIAAAVDRRPEPAAVTGPVLPLGPQPPGMHGVSFRDRADAVDFRAPAIPWATGSGANFAARTHALRAIGGWDERLGTGTPGRAAEDSDLLYRILRDGGTVRYEPAAVVRHEWQTWSRRLATRWSYGFGIGAMCGLWLRQGDWFTLRMLGAYARLHVRPLARAAVRRDRDELVERWRALASVGPGLVYGLRVGFRS